MKFANVLMLTSILLSNFTGGVQARADNKEVSKPAAQESPSVTEVVYNSPSFARPEPRIAEARAQDTSVTTNQKQTQQQGVQTNLGFTPLVVYLSDLDPIFAIEGWGGGAPLQKDKSVGGGIMTINGATYTKGLGVHSYSEYIYELNKGYTSFLSDIGIDGEVGSAWCNYLASVNFYVYVDGVLQYSGNTLWYQTPTEQINVNITGASQLKLVVTDGGSSNIPGEDPTRCDHADWADAHLTAVNPLTDDAIICPGDCGGYSAAINQVGDPINTRTGAMSYPIKDLSIPTSSGQINFQRTYSSAATTLYTTPLGIGWTHNHDMHLVFPTDPEGLAGILKLKDFSGNFYRFWDVGDGTYIPYSGVTYSLVKNNTIPVTYTVKDTNQNNIALNSSGRITSRVDSEGNVINYVYDSNDRLYRINAGSGTQYIELTYNTQSQLINVKDQTGRDVSYSYNGQGDLETSTDVLDKTWTFTYDTTHHLVEVIDPNQKAKVHTDYYPSGDWVGRAWKQFDGNGNLAAELTYHSDGDTTITDGLGNIITDAYNSAGVLGQQTDKAGGGTDKTFDGNFRPTVITDPLENTTNLTWDPNGANLKRIENALHQKTDIAYDSLNNPTSVIDPLDYETKYFYEDLNFPTLLTKIEYPLSFDGGVTYVSTLYEYYQPNNSEGQPAGKVKFLTDTSGDRTYYSYTSLGQAASIVRSYGTSNALTTTYNYDDYGNMIDMTDEAGVVNHNEYNPAGQLTRTVQNYVPARPQNDEAIYNLVTEYRYDVRGNQIASIDTYGVITRTYFDQADRPVTTIQNLTGQSIETSAPPIRSGSTVENLRTDTDYDLAGNVIATTDPQDVTSRTYYDEAGRPITTIQNLVGQEISVLTPPSYNAAFPDQNIHTDLKYDANGNNIASIDTVGVITRTYYDKVNRPVTVVQNLVGQDINLTTPPVRGNGIQNIRTDMVYDANGNTIATIDPAGMITRTYYDAMNRQTSLVQNLTGQLIGDLNLPERIAGATDENIRTDTYYDPAGNSIATVDPLGIVTRTYYDTANRPLSVVRNLRGQSIYITTIPAAGGPEENIRTDVGYDQYGRRNTSTDPLGQATKYEYNPLGQTIKVTMNYAALRPQNDLDKFNIVTEYRYDAVGRQEKTIDTLGRVTLNSYDPFGHLLTSTRNLLAGQPLNYQNQYNITTTFTYDRIGNQLSVTDPRNHTTHTEFDDLNRPISVTDSNQNVRTSTYDGMGNLRLVNNGLVGSSTIFGYDDLNRQTQTTDPNGNETRSVYNAKGELVLLTDAEGVDTRHEYDDLGRLTAVIENYQAGIPADVQTNVRTEYTYDSNGNRLSIKDGNGNITTFLYDDLNRLKRETDPLGHFWIHSYDAAGNQVATTDANGATTSYVYDANRLTTINYPGADPDVSFTYYATGLRHTMTDGTGTTTWTYDDLNRPLSITDPFNKTVSYAYDPVGNRTVLTYPDQHSVSYDYDDGNRLITVSSAQSQIASYEYDTADRLKQITRLNNANTAYNYDDASNLLSITNAHNSVELLSSFLYTYDRVGNRVQAVEKVNTPVLPATTTANATYTPTPLTTNTLSVTPTPNPPDTFTSTPVSTNAPTDVAIPSPSETETAAPTETITPSAAAQSQGFNYGNVVMASYPRSNKYVIKTPIGTPAPAGTEAKPSRTSTNTATSTPSLTPTATRTPTLTYTPTSTNTPTYTATITLTPTNTNTPASTATRTPHPAGSPTITYTPRPVATSTIPPIPSSTPTIIPTAVPGDGVTIINYDYDPLYRLTAADYYYTNDFYHYTYDAVGNRKTQESLINGVSSTVNYDYDTANRLTTAGGQTYTFDANGNLLSDGANSYVYDSANRLTSVNGTTTYAYNGVGDRLSQTVNGIPTNYTLDLNAGLTQVLDNGTNTYTYGLGRISQQNGSTPEYFLGDALGSVRQMTNQAGTVTFLQNYDPYGVVTTTSGTSQTDYGFTGESYGDSTQLLYLRARYYNPADGRFQSRDTWAGNVDRPMTMNRWNYTDGNPVNRTDPSGHCWNSDGSWDWFKQPWFGPCPSNTGQTNNPPTTQTPLPPTTTPECPTPTMTPSPTNAPLPTPTGYPKEIALYYLKTYSDLGKTLYDQSIIIGVIFDYNPDRCAGQSQGKKIWVNPCGTPTYDAGTIAHEMYHILNHTPKGGGSKYEEYGSMLVGDIVRSQIIARGFGTSADMRNSISAYTVDLYNPNQAQLETDLNDWFKNHEPDPSYKNLPPLPPTPTPTP